MRYYPVAWWDAGGATLAYSEKSIEAPTEEEAVEKFRRYVAEWLGPERLAASPPQDLVVFAEGDVENGRAPRVIPW